MYVYYVCVVPTEAREGHWTVNPLELEELQSVVSHHVETGLQTWVLY